MTGAGAVLNVLDPQPGSSVVVFGTGAVGLSGMLAAKASGATTLIMADIVPERLEFAKELGATHTINSKDTDPVAAIQEITGGGADYALDTTGVPAVFTQMSNSLATMGHGALVGAASPGTMASIDIGARSWRASTSASSSSRRRRAKRSDPPAHQPPQPRPVRLRQAHQEIPLRGDQPGLRRFGERFHPQTRTHLLSLGT